MIKNDENKLINQPRWFCLLWPVSSHLSCSWVTNSVIFRKHHFLGLLPALFPKRPLHYLIATRFCWCLLHSSSCSADLLVHIPPFLWPWVVLSQHRTLVLSLMSMLGHFWILSSLNSNSAFQHTQLLLQQILWRHRPLLPSRTLLRMQRVLTWQGPLGVTLLIISHLKLLMANLWAQPSSPFSTHFYSTPPVPNFPGDWVSLVHRIIIGL